MRKCDQFLIRPPPQFYTLLPPGATRHSEILMTGHTIIIAVSPPHLSPRLGPALVPPPPNQISVRIAAKPKTGAGSVNEITTVFCFCSVLRNEATFTPALANRC